MKLQATITNQGTLTPQETRVLQLLCTGLLRKQIAHQLHRSYGSVSKQIESIALKLNAHSAAEIVAKAVASGLVQISYKALLLVLISQCCLLDDDQHRCQLARTRLTIRHTAKREL